jgi:hypothetical protein
MRNTLMTLGGFLVTFAVVFYGAIVLFERTTAPDGLPGEMPFLESNQQLNTVNTTRVGSDDPIETAAAVSQIIYPATEEENVPGAVILIRPDDLQSAIVAASRIQHFPVNAPLLYVEEDSIPELTRNELLRLAPEGVAMDGNVQVYIVGNIDTSVEDAVQDLGYKTRAFRTDDAIELSEMVDDWTSTQHGDHINMIAVANLDRSEFAIPAAFWNAHAGDGLVYVTDDGIPDATRRILERRASGPWLYLFGDNSVISDEVARELAQFGHVTRMPRGELPAISSFFAGHHDSGEDWGWWFEASDRAFGWGNAEAGRNAIFVNVDGPGGWANALSATTLSHMGKHAPVLIVEADEVPTAVENYLAILKPYPTAPQEQLVNHGWIIGGEDTISWSNQADLDLQLEAYPFATPANP